MREAISAHHPREPDEGGNQRSSGAIRRPSRGNQCSSAYVARDSASSASTSSLISLNLARASPPCRGTRQYTRGLSVTRHSPAAMGRSATAPKPRPGRARTTNALSWARATHARLGLAAAAPTTARGGDDAAAVKSAEAAAARTPRASLYHTLTAYRALKAGSTSCGTRASDQKRTRRFSSGAIVSIVCGRRAVSPTGDARPRWPR